MIKIYLRDFVGPLIVLAILGMLAGGIWFGYATYKERMADKELAKQQAIAEAERLRIEKHELVMKQQAEQEAKAEKLRAEQEARYQAQREREEQKNREYEAKQEQIRKEAEAKEEQRHKEQLAREKEERDRQLALDAMQRAQQEKEEQYRKQQQIDRELARRAKLNDTKSMLAEAEKEILSLDKTKKGYEAQIRNLSDEIKKRKKAIDELKRLQRELNESSSVKYGSTAIKPPDYSGQIAAEKIKLDTDKSKLESSEEKLSEINDTLSALNEKASQYRSILGEQPIAANLEVKAPVNEATPPAKKDPIYHLKDGTSISAKLAMDMGDVYAIKDTDGKMHNVKKDSVERIEK